MKLSVNQAKVLKLMQKGWELGVDTTQIGFTVIQQKGRLQKNGLGHGDPTEHCKATTVYALQRKRLIQPIDNPYIMTQPTVFVLTEKGKKFSVITK